MRVLMKIDEDYALSVVWIIRNVSSILDRRIKQNIHRKDYMQLLIDAHSENVDKSRDNEVYSTEHKIDKKLTLKEVNSNVLVFLLAGFDTTSTTLSYSFYILATHSEELKKLQNEIDKHLGGNIETTETPDEADFINYETINELEYLDLFLKEVLRMYPPASFTINRRCTNPIKIKGIQFSKGLTVAVDVLSLHYDQKYWGPEDTQKFYPLRHLPEYKRNPACFLPFGYGPRKCVGERFALLELKLALVKTLIRFNILQSPNTPKKMKYFERLLTRQPEGGVPCILKHRYKNQ